MKESLVNQGCNADVRSDKIETIYYNGNLGRGIFDSYRASVQKNGAWEHTSAVSSRRKMNYQIGSTEIY